jgi:sialidase-1
MMDEIVSKASTPGGWKAVVLGGLLLFSRVGPPRLLPSVGRSATSDEQGLSQSDIFISGMDGYHTYRIPALIVTKKGTLLAFCEGRRNSSSDTGEIDMLMKRSLDGGRSWSHQQVIWHDGSNTCGNACPVVDQTTGTVWLLLTHNLGQDGEGAIGKRRSQGTRTAWVCKSADDGLSWSKPIDITATVKNPEWGWYATGPGIGIQLKRGPHAGRLLIPIDYSAQPYAGRPDVFEYGDAAVYSDDHGDTWHLGGVVPSFKLDEQQVVELYDGSLLMNMRAHFGNSQRAVAFSNDGGGTWNHVGFDETLIEPDCQGSFIRYTERPTCLKNRLLFSNPANRRDRIDMTVRLSYDEGKTWSVSKRISAGSTAYSCLAVLPDMTVGCLYERGEKNAYEKISLARFSIEWLTDGADRIECQKTNPIH